MVVSVATWALTVRASTYDVRHVQQRQAEHDVTLQAMPDRYVPRAEIGAQLRAIDQRLERIETKLDRRLASGDSRR